MEGESVMMLFCCTGGNQQQWAQNEQLLVYIDNKIKVKNILFTVYIW